MSLFSPKMFKYNALNCGLNRRGEFLQVFYEKKSLLIGRDVTTIKSIYGVFR